MARRSSWNMLGDRYHEAGSPREGGAFAASSAGELAKRRHIFNSGKLWNGKRHDEEIGQLSGLVEFGLSKTTLLLEPCVRF